MYKTKRKFFPVFGGIYTNRSYVDSSFGHLEKLGRVEGCDERESGREGQRERKFRVYKV